MKAIKPISIIVGILLFESYLAGVGGRQSIFYLVLLSFLILPLCWFQRFHFKKIALLLCILALLLLAIPVDFALEPNGDFHLQLLPAHYGIVAKPGTYSYGCVIPRYPPRSVLVLSF